LPITRAVYRVRVSACNASITECNGLRMSYWAVARLEHHREQLALHCLALAGYTTYLPRLRERRLSHGRKIEVRPPLFPGYAFVVIEQQWHAARWSLGVAGLIMDGIGPARVADHIIAEIRSRERDGLIELPQRKLVPGDPVQVIRGPLRGLDGLYAGMRPHERCMVLLAVLGGQRRVILPRDDIERARRQVEEGPHGGDEAAIRSALRPQEKPFRLPPARRRHRRARTGDRMCPPSSGSRHGRGAPVPP
jgi:transcriptional antiterminator RfaH